MDDTRRAVDMVARDSYGRLVAILAARTSDLAAAEDALGEAFAVALQAWPRDGVPENPAGWLITAARRRLIDAKRSGDGRTARGIDLSHISASLPTVEDEIPDERLRLLFACAHPAVDPTVHSPLMLQAVLGLEAADIARAFLVAPATLSQRLVRAKGKIRDAGIRFDVPTAAPMADRLPAVLEAIYTAFGCGWDGVGGSGRVRGLADEAVWLGRVLIELLPDEPEARGLLALMLHSHARRDARRSADGRFVPLAEQDTTRWHVADIDEAERHLVNASRVGRIGRFQLEAAIQSAHNARRQGLIDWTAVAHLYEGLVRLEPSIGALVSRAVAAGNAFGPERGLELLAEIEPSQVISYQPYWAARGHLLAAVGRSAEADAAFATALGLTNDPSVRAYLWQQKATVA